MSEIGDTYTALKQDRQALARRRRRDSSEYFETAQMLAAEKGLTLRQCSDAHYQFEIGESLLNFYPGNQRLFWDTNHPRGKHLRRPVGYDEWTLFAVLMAIDLKYGATK